AVPPTPPLLRRGRCRVGAVLEGAGIQPVAAPGPRTARRTGHGGLAPVVHEPHRLHLHHRPPRSAQPSSGRAGSADVVERLPAQRQRFPVLLAHDRIRLLRGARAGASGDPGRQCGAVLQASRRRTPSVTLSRQTLDVSPGTAYVAWPARADRPLPVVVVVSDIWGDGDHLRDVADRVAGSGYLAVAPDLYSGLPTSEA